MVPSENLYLPKLANPEWMHSNSKIGTRWNKTKQSREMLPNLYYTYRHSAGIPRLMGRFQMTGLWRWTFKEITDTFSGLQYTHWIGKFREID